MKDMDITQVVERSGLPASTLRYYEEKGLIRSVGRRGMKRLFDGKVLERLALIALGRAAGFSLDDIREMLGGEHGAVIDRQRLAQQARSLEEVIRRMAAIREGLLHAAECPEEHHLACPTFQRLMKVALRAAGREAGRPGKARRRP